MKAFVIGCAVLLLVVGCAGTSSNAPKEKQQGHTEATKKEQTRSPQATASEEARCDRTRTVKAKGEDARMYGGTSVTNDVPGCPNGGLLLGTDNLRTDKIDYLDGKEGDDEIRGLGGEDLLFGGPGNDVIYGGPGGDFVSCGHGHDEVFADRADVYGGDCERVHLPSKEQGPTDATKKEQGRSPQATASEEEARCEGTKSRIINNESVVTNDVPGCPKGGLLLGTDKKDELSGEKGDDEIRGLGGNDALGGGPGSDILYGGDGDDFLYAAGNGDVMYGGDGNDQLSADLGGPRAKLYCGEGKDVYDADKDDYVDSSCEKKTTFAGGA